MKIDENDGIRLQVFGQARETAGSRDWTKSHEKIDGLPTYLPIQWRII